MLKAITALSLAVTLAGCSMTTTEGPLDNKPVNINMLCLFSCSVEAEVENNEADNNSTISGGDQEATSETSGSLDATL